MPRTASATRHTQQQQEVTSPQNSKRGNDHRNDELVALDKKQQKWHQGLDLLLVITLACVVTTLGDWPLLFKDFQNFLQRYPDYYTPVFDFINYQIDPSLAVSLWVVDMYFVIKTYYIEEMVVAQAHKKYQIHKKTVFVALHGIGSTLEFLLGLLAVLNPESKNLAYATALLALCVNIPTGFAITPGVFGIKSLTVPGFFKFGYLRLSEVIRVFFVHHRLVANLWILLHVGTLVRLLGYFILPYTSANAERRGDLFTEPVMYSFNILLSGFITAAFVYPPKFLLGSLIVYVIGQWIYPPKVLSARIVKKQQQQQ